MKTFDTNVLIYAIDQTDVAKHQRAIELLEQVGRSRDARVIVWQVACEYLAFLRRQHRQGQFSTARVTQEFSQILGSYDVVIPDRKVFSNSTDLFLRYSLSHWDSLLLGACIVAGVDTLYSEDMSHNGVYDSVTVINPFTPS